MFKPLYNKKYLNTRLQQKNHVCFVYLIKKKNRFFFNNEHLHPLHIILWVSNKEYEQKSPK